jgi:hypothetical protein
VPAAATTLDQEAQAVKSLSSCVPEKEANVTIKPGNRREKLPRIVQETGLLEQSVLLVPASPGQRRRLLAVSGQPVGFARRLEQGSWWSWWCSGLAVHEEEDQPLVFTIKRRFILMKRREVVDADGELVGTVALPWLLDRWGKPVVEVRPRHSTSGAFLANGSVVGEWSLQEGSLRLAFMPAIMDEPYLKMLLLAAILQAPSEQSSTTSVAS